MKLAPDIASGLPCYQLCDAGWTTLGELEGLSLDDVDRARRTLAAVRRSEASR